MQRIPGWVGGALGAGALMAAFYLGGQTGAAADVSTSPASAGLSEGALQVQCEPGQRAVVDTRQDGAPATVTCANDARPVPVERTTAVALTAPSAPAYAPGVITVAESVPVGAVRQAVLTAPTEIYQPRPRRTTGERRGEAAPAKRTWERSAVIIGSSAAVGATVGGLAKGKKGAIVGGIVGGGAATVWDQVTRRRTDGIDR